MNISRSDIFPQIKIKNWQIFCGLTMLNILIIWLVHKHLFRIDIFFQLFGQQMEISRLERQMEIMRSWFNLNYLLVPVSLFLKLVFISFVIQFPLLLRLDDVPLAKIFRIVMIASLAILACSVVQYTILFLKPVESIDAGSLSRVPLSLANLAGTGTSVSDPVRAVLARFNVFELLWCSIIYYGLNNLKILKHTDILLLVAAVWIFLLIMQWIVTEILILLSI